MDEDGGGLEVERREARAALVPVEVVEDATTSMATFCVELKHHRTIVVASDFDAASLRRLVAALEQPAC